MNQNNNKENLIGILLILPVYILIFIAMHSLKIHTGINMILLPVSIILPIVIGLPIVKKEYKEKVDKTAFNFMIFSLALSIYLFYNTYFMEHQGFDAIGTMFFGIVAFIVYRVSALVLYSNLFGKKKMLKFLAIYIALIVLSFAVSFWA